MSRDFVDDGFLQIGEHMHTRAELDAAVAIAVAAEREACAKIAEETAPWTYESNYTIVEDASLTQEEIAKAIRARGEK